MPSVSGNAAQFGAEGESLDKVLGDIEAQAEKTASESPTEKEPEAETQSSSGEAIKEDAKDELLEKEKEERAFNKRWKERLQKRDEEWEQRLKEQEDAFNQRLQVITPPSNSIPGWVRDIYGDSPEGVKFYEKFLQEEKLPLREQIKQELLQEQRRSALEQKQEEAKWSDWVEDQLQELEDEGKTFDRNELQKVAVDYMPSDEDGNIDFHKAYAIMEKLQSSNGEKSRARKELAAATTSRTEGSEERQKEYQTPATLRNKSWRDLLR